jgi:hypothetical protein
VLAPGERFGVLGPRVKSGDERGNTVFDKHYFDYAIASGGIAGGPFFPAGLPSTIGLYNAFPLAGRSFVVQAGASF